MGVASGDESNALERYDDISSAADEWLKGPTRDELRASDTCISKRMLYDT